MNRFGVALFAASIASAALPAAEQHRLGAFLAYLTATVEVSPSAPCTPVTPDGVCEDCNNLGWVGDGTIRLPCPNPDCPVRKCLPDDAFGVEQDAVPLVPVDPSNPPAPGNVVVSPSVIRLPGPSWTFENYGTNPSTSVKARHLLEAHGIDPSGMTSQQMSDAHNNAHNYGDGMAFGMSASVMGSSLSSSSLSSSCPTGTCPSSSSRRSTSTRRGLFGRRR